MIPEKICVDFKSATKAQRKKIGEILLANYTELVNEMVAEADYGTTTSYWKDFNPISKKIMKAEKFIAKYGTAKQNGA